MYVEGLKINGIFTNEECFKIILYIKYFTEVAPHTTFHT